MPTQRVKVGADPAAVVDAMKSTLGGLNFLDKSSSLHPYTFVSAEAVAWVIDHVDGVVGEPQAVHLLEKMVAEKFICHASGNVRSVDSSRCSFLSIVFVLVFSF